MSARVYLDMDPGIDDAVAMVLATAVCDVAGVATVAGNVDGFRTFRNALRILRMVGREDIPVHRGSDRPLFGKLETASEIHGTEGLGLAEAPKVVVPDVAPGLGWRWLAEQAKTTPDAWDVIATGPLTNLARMGWGMPESLSRVGRLVVMGGSLSGGNITSSAEFNFFADPDAAEMVLGQVSGVELIGLDVTRQAYLTLADVDRFREYGAVGQWLHELLRFYAGQILRLGFSAQTLAVHDAVAVFAWAHPEAISWEAMRLGVVREGQWRGTLLADPRATERPLAKVALGIDADAFRAWIFESMEKVVEMGMRQ